MIQNNNQERNYNSITKTNKYYFYLFVLTILFSTRLFPNKEFVVKATNCYDEKIYAEIDIDEEFDDDTIIVIMDKLLSEKNKIHSPDFFGSDIVKEVIEAIYYLMV